MKFFQPTTIAAVFTLVGAAPCQAPPGHLVVAAFNPGWAPRQGMTGGLFLMHPRNPGLPIAVQGLPLELTGTGVVSRFETGLGSVLALPNGDLLVGEETPPPGAVPGVDANFEVHRVTLSQSQGVWTGQVISYQIGVVAPGAGATPEVSDLELLPNGDVLLSIWGPQYLQAPMNGVKLAILNLNTGVVTQVSVGGFPSSSTVNALAVSANGQTAYLGEADQAGQMGNVWSVPLPGGSGATNVTRSSTMGAVTGLDRDNQGQIVIGTNGANGTLGASPNLHLLNPATGVIVDLLPGLTGVRNAVLVERNTGDYFTGGVRIDYVPQGAREVPLVGGASGFTAPWGIVGGFAMVPAVESFGSRTGGAGPYEWQTTPNPGGLPLLGSGTFSITLDTAAAPSFSLVAIADAVGPSMVLSGFTTTLNPTRVLGGWLVPGGGTMPLTIPLAMPNNALLRDYTVYAQTFHQDSSGLVSSPELSITIL